jgi:hypothetical protein
MTQTVIRPGVIHTLGQLQQYIKNLLPHFQLRFISSTSLQKTFGSICIVFDKENDAVLLIPYNLKKSHEEVEETPVPENPESLAIRAIAKEAKLKSLSLPQVLGSPMGVPDRQDIDEVFYKYITLITQFEIEERVTLESTSEKNGQPIWISRELLSYVFEEVVIIKNEPRSHPHKEAYLRFMEYFPLFKDMEKW